MLEEEGKNDFNHKDRVRLLTHRKVCDQRSGHLELILRSDQTHWPLAFLLVLALDHIPPISSHRHKEKNIGELRLKCGMYSNQYSIYLFTLFRAIHIDQARSRKGKKRISISQ